MTDAEVFMLIISKPSCLTCKFMKEQEEVIPNFHRRAPVMRCFHDESRKVDAVTGKVTFSTCKEMKRPTQAATKHTARIPPGLCLLNDYHQFGIDWWDYEQFLQIKNRMGL